MYFKHYIRMMLAVVTLSVSSLISAQTGNAVLTEDFEKGSMPAAWTQEYVTGHHDWVIEGNDLENPEGAVSGKYRAVLRNYTKQREGFKTRLILPAVDITELTKPVVSFSYAQAPWAGDFDTLRVLYRTTATDPWIILQEFGAHQSTWKSVDVELGIASSTAQVAFEGVDNLGRGIVIDDITIRSCPECKRPVVTVSDITGMDATIYWSGSVDTKEFHIRVSKEPLSELKLNSGRDEFMCSPIDELVHGSLRFYTIEGLELGTEYYVYVRAVCGEETSLWSSDVSFSTLQKVSLPYKENFNFELTGVKLQCKDWHFGTSYNKMVPYINTHLIAGRLGAYSIDATPCLMFADEYESYPLPKDNYAYACTPEIDVDDISKVQVSFIGSRGSNANDVTSLIVGVMSDPKDYSTFSPIDTVSLDKNTSAQFEYFNVPLTKADADAKYIALVSDFDFRNSFYVEDFEVSYIPTCRFADGLSAKVKGASQVLLDWNSYEATKGDVLFVKRQIAINENVDEELTAMTADEYMMLNDVDIPALVEVLNPRDEYYVHVRNRCGNDSGRWSVGKKITMPDRITSPYGYDFEIDPDDDSTFDYPLPSDQWTKITKGLTVVTNSTQSYEPKPQCKKDEKKNGDYALYAQSKVGINTFVIFPEFADLSSSRVLFNAKSGNNNNYGHLIVGVLSDALDTTSFDAIDTVRLSTSYWGRFVYDMSHYSVEGKFLGFKYVVIEGKSVSDIYVDDLYFSQTPRCLVPKTSEVEVSASLADITWDDNGATAWRVRVSEAPVFDSLQSETYEWKYDEKVETNKVTITGLLGNGKSYYYYIQSLCSSDDVDGDWIGAFEFRTNCYDVQPIPYTFRAEDAVAEGNQCSLPCITEVGPGEVKMDNMKRVYISTSRHNENATFVILPTMSKPLNELYMDITAESGPQFNTFEVGSLKSVSDTASFIVKQKIEVPNRTVVNERVYLTGFADEYDVIAIRVPKATAAQVYLKSIIVGDIQGCAEIKNLVVE